MLLGITEKWGISHSCRLVIAWGRTITLKVSSQPSPLEWGFGVVWKGPFFSSLLCICQIVSIFSQNFGSANLCFVGYWCLILFGSANLCFVGQRSLILFGSANLCFVGQWSLILFGSANLCFVGQWSLILFGSANWFLLVNDVWRPSKKKGWGGGIVGVYDSFSVFVIAQVAQNWQVLFTTVDCI